MPNREKSIFYRCTNTEPNNWQAKPITEFDVSDTLWVQRAIRPGYNSSYLCRFVRFERGLVTADIIGTDVEWHASTVAHMARDNALRITARLKKCFLFGKAPGDKVHWPYAHWFDPKTKTAK